MGYVLEGVKIVFVTAPIILMVWAFAKVSKEMKEELEG